MISSRVALSLDKKLYTFDISLWCLVSTSCDQTLAIQ